MKRGGWEKEEKGGEGRGGGVEEGGGGGAGGEEYGLRIHSYTASYTFLALPHLSRSPVLLCPTLPRSILPAAPPISASHVAVLSTHPYRHTPSPGVTPGSSSPIAS